MRTISWFNAPILPVDKATTYAPARDKSPLARRLFLLLGAVALVYAALAGLRTVYDPDLGWQLASGRWIAQHHWIFSTDVFSYTATGRPWIYPFGSQLLLYAIYRLGGYALLSWFGAVACVATVALLLRRGSAFTAAIAIIATPLIAERTGPRAEMFSVILFAAFLTILWQNYQTSRAPLWLLPVLMIAWVNLHLGFIAGLALIVGFIGLEFLEVLSSAPRRSAAVSRLRQVFPWFVGTALATLVNPLGWVPYRAMIGQNRDMEFYSQVIPEWAQARWHWGGAVSTFTQRPMQNSLNTLAIVVLIGVIVAILQRRLGCVVLLVGAMYVTMRHIRMEALTACVVVVVAGSVLADTIPRMRTWIPDARLRSIAATAAVVMVAAVACLRGAYFITNRIYLESNAKSNFGAGLSWWFPDRAAAFVERENLPAQVFNNFDEGGFILWRLGDKYRDYIDGRAIPFGVEGMRREHELVVAPVDSTVWQQEADRYNINTMVLEFATGEIEFAQLQDLCYAKNWRPVYLDEVSIVLVRRKPETEELINRLQVSCATAPLPAQPLDRSARSFQPWANSAHVLAALRRTNEALSAADTAFQIFPGSAPVRWVRGNALYASDRRVEAEQEWLAAIALGLPDKDSAIVWSRLGELYDQQERVPDALHAWQQTAQLTSDPATKTRALVKLARLYLVTRQPKQALQALDEAEHSAPAEMTAVTDGRSFKFDVAQGRAAIWRAMGDLDQAVAFQEQAVKLDPDAADAWSHLAKLYQRQGRVADEHRAEERANALGASQNR
ncbi:MAG: tetratricopeptide repeat protein [Candidatus Korobacteraceae bacterium]